MAVIARAETTSKIGFSLFDPDMQVPYTIQSMISVQRQLGRSIAAEIGYLRTDGNDFPLQRQFTQAFDRQTGLRPNPALGAPGGYYVDSSQSMIYNGLQTSLRKRFSNRHSWDVNYTFSKSEATQGGDLSAYYIAWFENNQDFFNPEYDYGPASNDVRHRLNVSFIYEVPELGGGRGMMNAVLGGWQLSGTLQARSGSALRVTQASGIDRSRPDVVEGADLILDDWQATCTSTGCNYSEHGRVQERAGDPPDQRDASPRDIYAGHGARSIQYELQHDYREEFQRRSGKATAGAGRRVQRVESQELGRSADGDHERRFRSHHQRQRIAHDAVRREALVLKSSGPEA